MLEIWLDYRPLVWHYVILVCLFFGVAYPLLGYIRTNKRPKTDSLATDSTSESESSKRKAVEEKARPSNVVPVLKVLTVPAIAIILGCILSTLPFVNHVQSGKFMTQKDSSFSFKVNCVMPDENAIVAAVEGYGAGLSDVKVDSVQDCDHGASARITARDANGIDAEYLANWKDRYPNITVTKATVIKG